MLRISKKGGRIGMDTAKTDFLCNEVFRMTKGDFARKMFLFWGVTPAIVLSLWFVAGLVLGIVVNIVYFAVAAMALFIVLPLVMMFLYYSHGLNKYCYFNVVDHNISLSENGVMVTMYFPVTSEGSDDTDNNENETKKSEVFINYSRFGAYRVFSDSVVFPIDKPVSGFLWMPLSAFEDGPEFENAVRKLSSKLTLSAL